MNITGNRRGLFSPNLDVRSVLKVECDSVVCVYLDVCVPEAHITVPDGIDEYEEKYFCSSCRELMKAYSHCGFVLADLRNPETPTVYPVEVGTEFEVRCYTVVITETDKGELDISVIGTIPTEE